MKKQNKVLIIGVIAILFIAGCGHKQDKTAQSNQSKPIMGKFLFASKRNKDGKFKLCSIEKGVVRDLGYALAATSWSPDCKFIAMTGKDGGVDLFDSNGMFVRNMKIDGVAMRIRWFPDGKQLLLILDQKLPDDPKHSKTHLAIYDIEKGTLKYLYEPESRLQEIWHAFISNNGKRILFCVNDPSLTSGPSYTYTMDTDGTNLEKWCKYGIPFGWMPDDVSFVYATNIKSVNGNNVELYNNEYGCLFKLNTKTGKTVTLWDSIPFYSTCDTLTPDGKYIYYAKSFPSGGTGIAYTTLEKYNETIVTTPVFVDQRVGYSDDLPDDWRY